MTPSRLDLARTVPVFALFLSMTLGCFAQIERPPTAPRLFAPTFALMDEVLDIRVAGLTPGQRIVIRASTVDSARRTWRAEREFAANARGGLALKREPPAGGAYSTIAMGIVTAMQLEREPFSRYILPGLDYVPLGLALIVDGRVVDSATILRGFLGHGVRATPVREQGLVGTLFSPPKGVRRPGVLVVGGSEGGNSATAEAAQLASRGFVTLSLAYFAAASLPREIDQIPLEYFSRAITFLASRQEVDPRAIGLLGTSKGAEAALLVAARDDRVRAVVAYAPSSVAWSCICAEPDRSSWSSRGIPVIAIPPGRDPAYTIAPGQPLRPSVHYRYRLRDTAKVRAATIPVERIKGPVMLVAGAADDLWPSAEMARQIRAKLDSARRLAGDTLLVYSGAGHLIGKSYLPAGSTMIAGGRIETGGTPFANALAQAHSWPRVVDFLSHALGGER